ncbi:MAG: hypothetical protein LBE51_14545 [Acidovorax sp.]|jgi:hypothetical protein|nr:hypothetical protein [Acidovorax sp.]MDR3005516.1 hypothetical protein [Acidovorax sp.]
MDTWMRKSIEQLTATHGCVPPPWVVYNAHPYSMCWRMGAGESHIMLWSAWWPQQALTQEQKIAYFRQWPLPPCWLPFLITAIWDVDTVDADDAALAPYFERTSALGFGGRKAYEADLDDPKWLEDAENA